MLGSTTQQTSHKLGLPFLEPSITWQRISREMGHGILNSQSSAMVIGPKDLLLIEKSILRGTWNEQIAGSSSPIIESAKLLVECRFRDVLTSKQAREWFQPPQNVSEFSFKRLILPRPTYSVEDELTRLVVGVACLHAFVQANWTGPDLDIQPLDLFHMGDADSTELTEHLLHAKAVQELAHGGEPAYHLSRVAAFLRISQLLISAPYEHLQSTPWWRLRVASVHQQVLDSPVVFQEDYRTSLQPLLAAFAAEPDLTGRINVELGLFELRLSQDKVSAQCFIKAARSTGLEYELTGARGRRTKFQIKDLPQLVLLAESRLETGSIGSPPQQEQEQHETSSTAGLPSALPLNDDTLLEQTEFTSSQPAGSTSLLKHIDPSSQPPLHPLDQCILLSLCLNVRNTSPSHGLTVEQMNPYVSRVISHPRNWSVHTMALLLRSRLESSRTRTIDRSTLQLQALIDQMPTSDSTIAERLLYIHSIPLPSRWEMEKELARRYLGLGVVKSALEIFERLEMWEDAVICYGALEKPERGIAIVRDLLEGRKEEADVVLSRGKSISTQMRVTRDAIRQAKLWCLLGDLEPLNAIDHYEKAWQISNETSGRAMRALGGRYFARTEYRKAMDCLKKAVKIHPLISRSWFILGCAAMRVEEWEEAKNAFSRCVIIDEDDGESWNNLASMYLRLGGAKETLGTPALSDDAKASLQGDKNAENSLRVGDQAKENTFQNKTMAFRALKQGLRYNYESWRMWSNYMLVSMDVGELQESCRALSRVVELTAEKVGRQAVDEDVLERLVDAVIKAVPKAEETTADIAETQNPNEGHGLHKNVLLLLEQTILPRLSSPRIFRAYARLLSWKSQWEATIKAYLDAYRCSSAGTFQRGEIETGDWRAAVPEVEEIVDVLRNFGPLVEGYKWRLQGQSIVRTFIGRSREFEDEPEWQRLLALQSDLR